LSVNAQKNKASKSDRATTSAPAEQNASASDAQFKLYRAIYEQGLRYNDLNTSTQALHVMIALRPEDKTLLDSLALVYFQRGAWGQCALVSTEVLKENPEKTSMLELRAVSYQSLGMGMESLADFEKLYPLTNNPYHLYEIASLQFSIRRYGECEATLVKLMGDESIKDKKLVLGSGQQKQDVPMVAACLNMRGVLDLQQGKSESAKAYLEAALKIMPDFELAKNNLAAANK
jgi:tetratricopeptide (TPR) repeat protein